MFFGINRPLSFLIEKFGANRYTFIYNTITPEVNVNEFTDEEGKLLWEYVVSKNNMIIFFILPFSPTIQTELKVFSFCNFFMKLNRLYEELKLINCDLPVLLEYLSIYPAN